MDAKDIGRNSRLARDFMISFLAVQGTVSAVIRRLG
jgi:hypothetical protein